METLFQIETLQIIIAIYLGSAALSLLAGWQLRDGGRGANLVAHGGAFLASALLVAFAAGVFLDGEGKSFAYLLPFPGVEFSFRIDGLSAFFLGLIGTIAALASLFGISYQKHFIGKYALGPFGFFFS